MEELIQTIPKNSVLDSSQNYEFLRQKGLEHIRNLGHKIWTDYNYHDPGITLMELLSYAITDLGYRTGFDMKDILAPADGNEDVFKECFHKASKIFPCNQVTVLDLKKIIIDLEGIRNVWIKTRKDFETFYFVDFNNSVIKENEPPLAENILSLKVDKLNGLLDIVIEFDRNVIKNGDTNAENEVLDLAQKEVHKFRNLCEDYLSTACGSTINQYVKKPDGTESIKLYADIDIESDAVIENILGEMLFKIEQFLAPQINFYSMQELFDKGKRSDQIFEGPLLNHGFIDNDELKAIQKFEVIHTSDLYNIIMDIPGVTAVHNLGISRQIDTPCFPALPLPLTVQDWVLELHNTVNANDQLDLELILNTNNPDDSNPGIDEIYFFKGEHEIPVSPSNINYNDVQSKLNALRISERKKKLKFDNEIFDLEIPKGEFRELDDYYPVQNELPLIYGTGEEGLALNASEERKAQAKQLKSYLLFCEQLLANYLSQLLHIRELFSWNDKIDKTYYSQLIKGIKDTADLYVPSFTDEEGNNVDLVIGNILQESTLEVVLQKDSEQPDTFYDRRNRFLNHLIARFNEIFTEYTMVMTGIGKKDQIIPDKAHFLADYDTISHDRGKGFDYKKIKLVENSDGNDYKPDVWDTENVTGYERRICRFLGIENYNRRFLFTGHNFSIESKMTSPTTEEYYFRVLIPFGDNYVQITGVDLYASFDDALNGFQSDFIPFATIFIYNEVDSSPDYYFEILNGTTLLATSQMYADPNDRDDAVSYANLYFNDTNEDSGFKENAEDGIHVVEHILLRPKDTGYEFLSIETEPNATNLVSDYINTDIIIKPIVDAVTGDILGQSYYEKELDGTEILLYTITGLNYLTQASELEIFSTDFSQYISGINILNKFYFYIFNDAGDSLGSSIEFDTKEDRDEALLKFLTYFNIKKGNPVATCHSTVDPYSFRASVILPAWTERAAEFTYRKMAETIIRMEAPAHIALDIFWIDRESMREFEIAYQKFLNENAKGIPNEEYLTQNSTDLKNYTNDLINILNNLTDFYDSIYDIKVFKNEDYFREQPSKLGHLFADVTDPSNAIIQKATIIGGDPLPPFIDIHETASGSGSLLIKYPSLTGTFNVGDIVFVPPADDPGLENVYPGEWTISIETINENEQISCNEITIRIIADSEAVWIIEEPKHVHCYDVNDVLAYAFDANNTPTGEVVSATVQWGILPPGTTLTSTGKIIVTDPDALNAPVDLAKASITYKLSVLTEDFTGGLTLTKISILIPKDDSLSFDESNNCKHIDLYSDTDLNPHPNSTDIYVVTDSDGVASAVVTTGGVSLAFLNSIGIDIFIEGPIGEVNPTNIYFRVVDHALLKTYVDDPMNAGNTMFTVILQITDDCGYTQNVQVDLCIKPDIEATVSIIGIQHINTFTNNVIVAEVADVDLGINSITPLPDNSVLSDVGLGISYHSGTARIKVVNQALFEAASESGGLFTPTVINSQDAFTYSFNIDTLDNSGGTSNLTVTLEMYKDREAVYVFTFPSNTSYLAYLNYLLPQNYDVFEEVDSNTTSSQKSFATNEITPLNTVVLFDTNNPLVASVSDPDGPVKAAEELVDIVPETAPFSFYKLGSSTVPVPAPIVPVYDKPLSDWGAVLNPITGTISIALNSKLMKDRFLDKGIGTHYHKIKTTDIYGGTTIHELEIKIAADLPAVYLPQGTYPRSVGSYNPGDIIKYPSDPNGPIVKAQIISGTLPPGTVFDTANGEIRVMPKPEILVVSSAPNTINFTFGDVVGKVESVPTTSESSEKKSAPVTSTPPASSSVLTSGEWNLVISTVDVYGGVTKNIAVNIKIQPKITISTITAVKGKGTVVTSLPGKYPAIFPPKTSSSESK